jgi:hypothetical protein
MTFLEAQTNLARKLDITIADVISGGNDLFTQADLQEWVQEGNKRAWDYKPWAFTEKTYKATSLDAEYYDYPDAFEDLSIRILKVAGAEFEKINWDDYQKWFNEDPTDTTKLWAETDRFYFINQNAYTVGDEINVTGKLRSPTLTADGDLLLFSPNTDNQESSGNHAVVILAYAEALGSDKLKRSEDALLQEKKGLSMLDVLWKPMPERKSRQQSQNRPFFEVPDYFRNNNSPGRSTNIGNFP